MGKLRAEANAAYTDGISLPLAQDFRNRMSDGGSGLLDFFLCKTKCNANFQGRGDDLFWFEVIVECLEASYKDTIYKALRNG